MPTSEPSHWPKSQNMAALKSSLAKERVMGVCVQWQKPKPTFIHG